MPLCVGAVIPVSRRGPNRGKTLGAAEGSSERIATGCESGFSGGEVTGSPGRGVKGGYSSKKEGKGAKG